MTGFELLNRGPDEMDRETRIAQFGFTLQHLAELNPQGADSRYTAGALAWAKALGSPAVRELCADILETRSMIMQEPYLHIAELWMRMSNEAVQPVRKTIDWPYRHNREEAWEDIIYGIADMNGEFYEGFFVRGVYGTVQGNVPRRAWFPAMVAMLYRDRFGPETSLADDGACLNHTPNALMMPRNILKGIKVARGHHSAYEAQQLGLLTDLIEHSRPTFNHCTGYEVENMLDSENKPWDSRARQWVKINTIRPDEEVDQPELVEEYDEVDSYISDKIDFVRADFTRHPDEFEPQLGDDGHDIVNNSAMIYQHQSRPESVGRILQNCRAVGNRRSVISVVDFGTPSLKNPNVIRFFKKRQAYSFRGMVYDLLEPELGFQEIVKFKTGRCTEVIPGRDWHRFMGKVLRLAS